jgi:sec-independent protein translocase protein TatB
MFGISWYEILLLMVVAILVIPPKDLPRAMATAGRWFRQARLMMTQMQRGIDELVNEAELHELRRRTNEMTRQAQRPLTIDQLIEPPKMTPLEPPPHE